jgi:hypothetical protein
MMAPVVAGVRVGRYSDECGLEGFASGSWHRCRCATGCPAGRHKAASPGPTGLATALGLGPAATGSAPSNPRVPLLLPARRSGAFRRFPCEKLSRRDFLGKGPSAASTGEGRGFSSFSRPGVLNSIRPLLPLALQVRAPRGLRFRAWPCRRLPADPPPSPPWTQRRR